MDGGEAPRRRTFKLVVAYDGRGFAGWQRQAGQRSVQGDLEAVLSAIEKGPVHVAGAGRTDAGVHAAAQVASVRLTAAIAPERLVRAMNASLAADLRVLEASVVPDGFHARIHARGKTYRYFIWHAPMASPLMAGMAWHVPQRLSLPAMQEAAALFVGEHDFAAFQGRGSDVRSTVRHVWTAQVAPLDALPPWAARPTPESRLLCFEVAGSGFLRHQVRAMAGTLVLVGKGRMHARDVTRALLEPRREVGGPTAPPHGLHLWQVDYAPPERANLL
jgi:tRNA pseudouridine38-40 synthase